MTEKRFTLEMQYWKGNPQGKKIFDNLTGQDGMNVEELCNIASALHLKCEELESVLEVYKDVLGKLEDENKHFKMRLIEQLQIHYDYASEQRQKNLDNPFVAKAYEIIRYDVKKLAEEMGVDLE